MDHRVILYLLDSPQGHPFQYWTFEDQRVIRIGRAPDNDVVVPHPFVSRAHLELVFEAGAWYAMVSSKQGILLRGPDPLFELRLESGAVFRLGAGGPFLRFNLVGDPAGEDSNSTVDSRMAGKGTTMELALDWTKLMREVGEIEQDNYFQQLQAAREKLRGR